MEKNFRLSRLRVVLILSLVLFVAACGGGGGGDPVASGDGNSSVAYKVTAVAAIIGCPNGGIQVETGVDKDQSGVLETSEVTATQSVCNGETGASGIDGIDGADGNNGTNGLVAVTAEPLGTNCVNGGSQIRSGGDTDADGVLDATEVTSTDYVCNGLSGGGFSWVNVTDTLQQAVANTGYLANSTAEVTITLPATPTIGDIIRVSGIGLGGWKIAPNPGQTIYPGNKDLVWTPLDYLYASAFIALSADGSKLVVVSITGPIYTSADSGVTWTLRESSNRFWIDVASSADGTKLVAIENQGQIYTSADSGVTWTPRDSNRNWSTVASSADGTKLVATVYDGQIYTSADSGVTWTPRESNRGWQGVASSADGSKLVATSYGQIYTSVDSGVTWTPRDSNRNWSTVASSADGTKLVATVYGGQIYTSVDSGVTWTPRDSNRSWSTVASSADGRKLVAALFTMGSSEEGFIYTSTDFGATWSPSGVDLSRDDVAISADGGKLFAVGGGIYTANTPTGNVAGDQYEAIELQYMGNNTFYPLSYNGSLIMQ